MGIDFRPATGQLYALSDGNRFYTINTATGAATPVGNALSLIDIVKSFDIDPVSDQIRLETNLRKNIRVNPNNAAVVSSDALLAYAGGDPNAGVAPQVVQMAFTNSYLGAGSTTLYNLEAARDVLTVQTPQNNGILNTVGGLGVDLGTLLSANGMDISGQTGIAYVVGQSLLSGGMVGNTLYTLDLSTGVLSLAGPINVPQAGPLTFGGGGNEGGGGGGGENWCDPQTFGLIVDVATMPGVPEPSSLVLGAICGVAVCGAAVRRRACAHRVSSLCRRVSGRLGCSGSQWWDLPAKDACPMGLDAVELVIAGGRGVRRTDSGRGGRADPDGRAAVGVC